MERRKFIHSCGFACLSVGLLGLALESCGSATKIVSGTLADSNLHLPLSSFLIKDNKYRSYVVVQNEKLQFPICLYRFNENSYSALLMKCTHQGAELQVFGNKLECPAHGSVFNNEGIVQNGPADVNLRTFPVTVQQDQINISLR